MMPPKKNQTPRERAARAMPDLTKETTSSVKDQDNPEIV
jgi:hypothetical protein